MNEGIEMSRGNVYHYQMVALQVLDECFVEYGPKTAALLPRCDVHYPFYKQFPYTKSDLWEA